MGKIKFQVFGSHNSNDIDVIVFLDKLPNTETCKQLCKKYSKEIENIFNKKGKNPLNRDVDINLGVLKDGMLVNVFKGSVDEVNNSLFYTYDYHLNLQLQSQSITKLIERDLNVKMLRSTRIILSLLSRTEYRDIIKQSLRKDFNVQVDVINTINFSKIEDFGDKNGTKEDIYKRLVFQMGQTLALINGFDLYSKSSISGMYPSISKMMNRESDLTKTDLYNLEIFKRKYIAGLKNHTDLIGCENEKTYSALKNVV